MTAGSKQLRKQRRSAARFNTSARLLNGVGGTERSELRHRLRLDDLLSGEHDLFDPIDPEVRRELARVGQLAMEATIEVLTS